MSLDLIIVFGKFEREDFDNIVIEETKSAIGNCDYIEYHHFERILKKVKFDCQEFIEKLNSDEKSKKMTNLYLLKIYWNLIRAKAKEK